MLASTAARTRTIASLLLLGLGAVALGLPACVVPATAEEKAETTDETSQDLSTADTKIVGSLAYGQTSVSTSYTRTPRYRAYKFSGQAGDDVDVWVRSTNGDPVTWILDNDWKTIAKNDDAAPGNTNSHVKVKLPANASATHYIVVRDYWQSPMSFKVELKGGPADLAAGCNVDADCAKVAKTCCELGEYVAVRAGNEDAYRATLACPDPLFCPLVLAKPDFSMPQCNAGTHKCELVKPKDIRCGGETMNSHSCPDNYACVYPEETQDVPGRCFERCGGFTGSACSSPNDRCVDDPTDDCNPATGGADCGGICKPRTPTPTDCRATGCGTGQWCSNCWGSFQCIPNGAIC